MDERADLRVCVGLTGFSSPPSSSPASTDGLIFFFTGACGSSSSSPSVLSSIFDNDVFDLDALVLAADAVARPEDIVLDGGLVTFSFFSVVVSTVEPRFRFGGRVSIGVCSTGALPEREDRLGGIAQNQKRWWLLTE